jgi:heme-degrading monooxygenase HmoA
MSKETVMSYACVQDVPIGWEVYQQLMAELGDAPAEGLVVHLVVRRPSGLRYIDVWESREARQRFLDQRIHPVLPRLLVRSGIRVQGEPPPDEVEVLEVMRGPRAADGAMPYAAVRDVPIGWETYQQLKAEVGEVSAEGLIAHLVLRGPRGVRYVEVWESREARQRFVDGRIHPVLWRILARSEIKIHEQPTITEIEVLDVLWGPRASS